MQPSIVIIGAGQGISKAIAKQFGENNFNVILIARNKEHLEQIAEELNNSNISNSYYVADAGDSDMLKDVFEQIWETVGFIDVLVYNVAKFKQVNIAEETADSLTKDFKTNVAAAMTAIHLVLPDMEKHNKGTILLTGGGLALHPQPELGSLSLGKAAMRSLAHTLHASLQPKNIFVGTVTVCGFVSEQDSKYHPNAIASQFWKLYTERNEAEICY